MEIRETLEFLVRNVEGAVAALVMSPEGEAIDLYRGDPALDVEWIGARFGLVVRDVIHTVRRLEEGGLRIIVAELEKGSLAITPIGDTFYLILLVQPGGNLGQALFRCRMAASSIERALMV